MNYLQGLKQIIQETITASGGVWGDTGDIGNHGGDFGNGDWYATGDARNVFGLDVDDKKKKKKNKKKKSKFHVYRRAFTESLEEEELFLDCNLFATEEYQGFVSKMLESRGIPFNRTECLFEIHDTDENIQELINEIYEMLKEDVFTDNILVLIGEMNYDKGTNACTAMMKEPNKEPSDYNVGALRKGMEVEMEHTSNKLLARTIAMHHLDEDPQYYDKLAKMEGKPNNPSETNIKKKRPGFTMSGV